MREAILSRADKLLVIDNYGVWSRWPWPHDAAYFQPGSSGWLTPREFFSQATADSLGRLANEDGNLMNPANDPAAILSILD